MILIILNLVPLASNRVIFNCKDHDTAKFFSVDIGETEYYENTSTKSLNLGVGDRVNTSKQRRKEYLVTPEDIQSLPDLSAFVSIGHHNITMSKWRYMKLKTKAEAFIQQPNLDLVNVVDVKLNFMPVESPIITNDKIVMTQPEVPDLAQLLDSIASNDKARQANADTLPDNTNPERSTVV